MHQGDWAASLAAFGRAIDAQRELGLWGALPRTLAGAAAIQRRRGKTAIARAYLDEGRAIIQERRILRSTAVRPVWAGLAWLSLDAGQIRRAAGEAAQAAPAFDEDRGNAVDFDLSALMLAIAVAEGELDAAASLTETMRRAAERTGNDPNIARSWDARGLLLRACGDIVGAKEAISRAAGLWASLERPFEEGLSRLALGRLPRGHSGPGQARDLMHAHALLQPLGAEPALRLVRRELLELGMNTPRHRAPTASHELTERERELTALLAQRFGTAEIADRLVISSATVRTHIRNIFRKLSVGSRGELVLVARDRGLLN
jgi:DNA-binding CsgD family transcriptional regulator